MRELLNVVQIIIATIGAFLGGILGGFDSFLYALVVFVIIDYITGIMAAVIERKLASNYGFRGIFKKVLIFTLVSAAHIIDYRILESGSAIRTAVIFFYISNEGISILENAGGIGLPIPQKLMDVLHQLNREEDINE